MLQAFVPLVIIVVSLPSAAYLYWALLLSVSPV